MPAGKIIKLASRMSKAKKSAIAQRKAGLERIERAKRADKGLTKEGRKEVGQAVAIPKYKKTVVSVIRYNKSKLQKLNTRLAEKGGSLGAADKAVLKERIAAIKYLIKGYEARLKSGKGLKD